MYCGEKSMLEHNDLEKYTNALKSSFSSEAILFIPRRKETLFHFVVLPWGLTFRFAFIKGQAIRRTVSI